MLPGGVGNPDAGGGPAELDELEDDDVALLEERVALPVDVKVVTDDVAVELEETCVNVALLDDPRDEVAEEDEDAEAPLPLAPFTAIETSVGW